MAQRPCTAPAERRAHLFPHPAPHRTAERIASHRQTPLFPFPALTTNTAISSHFLKKLMHPVILTFNVVPKNIRDSTAVLQALRQYGEVVYFKMERVSRIALPGLEKEWN